MNGKVVNINLDPHLFYQKLPSGPVTTEKHLFWWLKNMTKNSDRTYGFS